MNNFNKSRFLAYGKWDWTLNRNLYRNVAVIILVLFLGVTLFTFLGDFALFQLVADVTSTSHFQAYAWLSKITLWSMAIMSGYLFHNMVTKKTQIMELTLPASMAEKFWWHVAVNIGGTLAICIIGWIISDLFFAILTALFMGTEHVHSLIGTLFTFDAQSLMSALNLSGEFNINGSTCDDEARIFFSIIPDFINKIILWIPFYAFSELVFYTGLFSFVNSRTYRYNIPITVAILIGLTIIIVIIAIAVVIGFAVNIDNMVDNNVPELLADFLPNLANWNIAFYAAELIIGALLWIGTYKGYKKAHLSKVHN